MTISYQELVLRHPCFAKGKKGDRRRPQEWGATALGVRVSSVFGKTGSDSVAARSPPSSGPTPQFSSTKRTWSEGTPR